MRAKVTRVPYSYDPHVEIHLPLLPVQIAVGSRPGIRANALVDSGSPCNVMPHSSGLALGLKWEEVPPAGFMGGAFAATEVRACDVMMTIEGWAPVRMAFAWASDDGPPLILGQVNFFQLFRVCFYRAELAFDIRPQKAQAHS